MPIPAQSGRQLMDSCKKNLNTLTRGDYVDAFVQKLELDESAIMEASLCDNSKFGSFITKKFQIENYIPIPMTFHMLFR